MTAATASRGQYVADIWVAAALAAVSLFFVVYLWTNPTGTPIFGVSAGTLPTAMSILLLVLAILLIAESLIAMRAAPHPPLQQQTSDASEPAAKWRPAALLVICIAYIVALPWAGYLLASAALVGATAWMFGNRRPVTLIALMVLAPLALSLFFEKAMVIYLPAGRLFD